MFRIAIFILVAAIVTPVPLLAAPLGGAQSQAGIISGTVTTQYGQPAANYTVRLRDVHTNTIAGSTTTAANGAYTVSAPGGQHVVEVVDPSGKVVGTTAALSVTPGTTVTANVTASQAAPASSRKTFPVAATIGAAAAGGIAAVVAVTKSASPSR